MSATIDFSGIRQRHDIVAFFESRGIRLRKCGSYFVGKCPFHDEQIGMALIVYPNRQKWQCMGKCQTWGDVVDATVRLDGLSTDEATRKLEGPPVVRRTTFQRQEVSGPKTSAERRPLQLPEL